MKIFVESAGPLEGTVVPVEIHKDEKTGKGTLAGFDVKPVFYAENGVSGPILLTVQAAKRPEKRVYMLQVHGKTGRLSLTERTKSVDPSFDSTGPVESET